MYSPRAAVVFCLGVFLSSHALADGRCQVFLDEEIRRGCEEALSKENNPARIENLVPSETARKAFRSELERAFLANGISMEVYIEDKSSTTLIFWGNLPKAFVHQLITENSVIDRAKALGFTKVDFIDKGEDGHFTFDLSGPGPAPNCAIHKSVCR